MNKKIFVLITLILTLLSTNIIMAGTIFNIQESVKISKGVTYTKSERVTDKGFLDVNILEVNVMDDNITLNPIFSEEIGKRDKVVNLVNDSGAIAGVNGDYFGMNGDYSASFSPEIKDGEISSYSTGRNDSGDKYASFILTDDDNVIFDYLKTDIHFKNNGVENIEINGINKVTDLVYPEIVTGDRVSSNAEFVERFPNMVTIVVDDGYITYISDKNEVVPIPETGYAVLIKEKSADYFLQFFEVGQTATLELTSSFDLDKIKASIGGPGMILKNGEIVPQGSEVVGGMQPRTAIGVTADNRVLLVTVDGRQKSVGATHEDMAQIMKELGCVDAMHLDGGGSTTMAVKEKEDDKASVVNTPSDLVDRKVIDGVGVFVTGEVGPTNSIEIEMPDKVLKGQSIPITISAYDEYLRKTDIDPESVQYTFDDSLGFVLNGEYIAGQNTGKTEITASLNGIETTKDVEIVELKELDLKNDQITVDQNQSAKMEFEGVDSYGETIPISSDDITYELSDDSLGTIEGNVFTGLNKGTGWIKASYGDIYTYFKVTVGKDEKLLYAFDNSKDESFVSYPSNITGSISFDNLYGTLNYTFPPEPNTKAAYLVFNDGIDIPKGTTDLVLNVKGDNSGNWLRGLIEDANGNEYRIDFTKNINFSDQRDLKASLPTEIVYPAKLTRLYVTDINPNDTEKSGSISIGNLRSVSGIENNIALPLSPQYVDEGNVSNFTITNNPDHYDVIITGDYINGNSKDAPNIDELNNNSKIKVQNSLDYLKNNQLPNNMEIIGGDNPFANTSDTYYKDTYSYTKFNDTALIQLDTAGGSINDNNIYQWNSMYYDVINNNCHSVIFLSDVSPTNFNNNEKSYFHRELLKLRDKGVDVFVVSTEKNLSYNKSVDGIKYINLDSTVVSNDEYTKKGQYVIIRFDTENEWSVRNYN